MAYFNCLQLNRLIVPMLLCSMFFGQKSEMSFYHDFQNTLSHICAPRSLP